MIKIHEVQKIYTTLGGGQHVLKDINLYFEKGQFVAILGKSGCGKTTLLNLIAGLDSPSSGQISISDKLMSKMSNDELDEFRNHKIGLIFQSYNLINHLNVLENVMISLEIAGKVENKKEKALKMLEQVGLLEHAHKLVTQLSGGQRQRVAIARALVADPEILLADEPTGALDSKTSIEIMDLIKSICKDKLVIFVTHNKHLADKYANRIIEMKDGRVINDTENLDKRVKIDLEKHLVNNKLSLRSSIKYSFKSAFKNKGKTVLISLGLAIGITLIALIDGVFNGARSKISKSRLLENNPIMFTNNIDDINDLKECNGVIDAFNSPQNLKVTNINGNPLGYIPISNTLMVPSQKELFNEYKSLMLYGDMPKNDEEIAISYDMMYSLINNQNDESDNIVKDKVLNKSITIFTNNELILKDGLIEYYDNLASNFNEDQFCFKFKVEDEYSFINLVDNNLIKQGERLNDSSDLLVQRAVGLIYEFKNNNSEKFFGDEINNEFYVFDYSTLSDDSYEIIEKTKNLTISGIFSAEAGDICMSNFILDDNLRFEFVVSYIYLDYTNIKDKISIINEIEKKDFMKGKRLYDSDIKSTSGQTSKFVLNLLQFVFTAISSVTLFTGAIMLWLILHVNISQRKREIGLLRSMGATKGDVKSIFVSESFLIGLLSCIISLILILIVTILANTLIPSFGYVWFSKKFSMLNASKPIIINIKKLLIIFGVGLVISMLAGLIPSSKAGNKKPIESLRGE